MVALIFAPTVAFGWAYILKEQDAEEKHYKVITQAEDAWLAEEGTEIFIVTVADHSQTKAQRVQLVRLLELLDREGWGYHMRYLKP